MKIQNDPDLMASISNLPADQQSIVKEYFLENKTVKELATKMNISETTVNIKIKKALFSFPF